MGEIFAGVLLMLKSELAVMQLCYLGYPWKFTFFLVTAWSTFRLITTFYITAAVDYWFIIPRHWDNKFNQLPWVGKIRESMARGKKKTVSWLWNHNRLIILLITFCPFFFVPLVKDAAVAVARLERIKGFLIWMVLANIARMIVVVLIVYLFF